MSEDSQIVQESFSSDNEFFISGPHVPYVQELCVAGRMPVTFITLDQPAGDFPDPPMPEYSLQMVTTGVTQCHVKYGGERFSNAIAPGSMVIGPPDTHADYTIDGQHAVLVLAFPKGAYQRFAKQSDVPLQSDFGPLHDSFFSDVFVKQLALRMYQDAAKATPLTELFVDTALTTLIAALVNKNQRRATTPSKGRVLNSAALRKVLAQIEDRMGESINLSDLADVLDLSDWQFIRAFKAAVGQTPHQYLLARRVTRARELLATNKLALSEIAYACGFASQSHMTDVFRQKLGITPGRYRKEMSISNDSKPSNLREE